MTAPTPLHESRLLGGLRIHALQAGGQQLDGGAMFGVVPKTLWERRIPADAKNRIPMGMRCLLIEHPDGLVLLDTGLGNKEDAKFHEIYGIEAEVPGHRTMLDAALAAAGFSAADVKVVINTHLHFDHAGGNTAVDESGAVVPAFPNARYLVHAGEMHYATHTNERTGASYFPKNWDVLKATGQLELVEQGVELVPGIRMRHTPGHTPHHQSIVVESGGETAVFLGDVCPTAAHVPLPWIMGYDVEPLRTLESKRALWKDVVEATGQLELVEQGVELVPGIWMRHTPGHTPHHQSIVVESGGETAVFLGDVCPTAAHVPLPWIMGYDVEPLRTLESKRALWKDVVEGGWLVVFEHDATNSFGRIRVGAKAHEFVPG